MFWTGFWRLADPRVTLASMSSLFLGFAVAVKNGSFDPLWACLATLGVFSIEVAKNASGEIFDFDSGTDLRVGAQDRSPFSGGKRVLVEGILTRNQTISIAATFYSVGVTIGMLIVAFRSFEVLYVGAAGVLFAYFYHGKPIQLSYRGLGELAVALCYGPLIAVGANLVSGSGHAWEPLLPSLPLGLLIGSFLWINEFPDHDADRESAKFTLVVRLGKQRASWLMVGLVSAAFGLLLVLPVLGYSTGLYAGIVGLPPAILACSTVVRHPDETSKLVPAQVQMLVAFLLYAVGAGIGMVLFPTA